MRSLRGVQGEVVASLAVLMATATALLIVLFIWVQSAERERLRPLLLQALQQEAERPLFALGGVSPGADWWLVSDSGHWSEVSPLAGPIDALSLELAKQAQGPTPLLRNGAVWEPMRFAVRRAVGGGVAVARIPPALPLGPLLAVLAADAGVFAVFGIYLLRGRVVRPLRELAAAVRSIGAAGPGARVQVDGVREVEDLSGAFNEMSEALEQRTSALEKAVTDLRQTNDQLLQARAGLDRAERLAAVGRLAAGVAHEVGNPMGALLAFMELADRDDRLSEQGRAHLRRAVEQGERVREILRQLLDFSRPPQARTAPVDLEQVARQVESLVRAQRRYENVRFEIRRAPGVLPVTSDASMLSQILLNLVINASDAVLDVDAPHVCLTLRPGHRRVREGEARGAERDRRAADAMECEVADNGPGVPASDRERIFDPFYTTKPPGEGTGLGLANALRLTEEIGGSLECGRSDALGGASFVLRIPLQGSEVASHVRGAGS